MASFRASPRAGVMVMVWDKERGVLQALVVANQRQIGKCGGHKTTVDADISEARPAGRCIEGKSTGSPDRLVDCIAHFRLAASPLAERPIIRCLPPKTPPPYLILNWRSAWGKERRRVGELQGDGSGRGNDCIPTETCDALRLHSVRDHLLGFLHQSGLILCLLPNA